MEGLFTTDEVQPFPRPSLLLLLLLLLLLFCASWPSLVVACRRRGAVSACGDCRDGSRSTDGRHSHVLHMRPRCRTTAVGLTQPGLRRSPWCYRVCVLSALRFPVWSEIRSTALRRALTGISSGTRPSASVGTCKCQVPALAHLEDAWSVFRQPSGPTATSVPYLINGPAKDVQRGRATLTTGTHPGCQAHCADFAPATLPICFVAVSALQPPRRDGFRVTAVFSAGYGTHPRRTLF